jgi:hypothetical protein
MAKGKGGNFWHPQNWDPSRHKNPNNFDLDRVRIMVLGDIARRRQAEYEALMAESATQQLCQRQSCPGFMQHVAHADEASN